MIPHPLIIFTFLRINLYFPNRIYYNKDDEDKTSKGEISINGGKESVKITEAETKNIEYDKYDNSLVSFCPASHLMNYHRLHLQH